MKISILVLLAILAFLFLNAPCEARKKKSKKAALLKSRITEEGSVQSSEDEPVEEVLFNSKEDMEEKLKKMQSEKQKASLDDEPLPKKEIERLEKEEYELKKNLYRTAINHGEFSREKATALHALGGNLFKQRRYEDILELAEAIVTIHEKLDGVEHDKTGAALGNLGAVAFRIKEHKKCELAMKRLMYILVKKHGAESKEVLLHRAKMLTFRVPDAEQSEGLSHYDYLDEL